MQENLKNEINVLPENAKSIIVTNNDQFESAGKFLTTIKGLRKEVNKSFDPIIKKAHDSHKEALKQKKVHTAPLDNAERIVKQTISKYLTECEMKRREEQRRLEEIERKKQEEQALLDAQNAETEDEADEIIKDAIENKPVVIAPEIEKKVEGVSRRMIWKYKINNVEKINKQFLIIDEKKIGQIVRTMGKNAESLVGGILVYREASISVRG